MVDAPSRAGRYVRQPAGYRAFIPAGLPPSPPLAIDDRLFAMFGAAAEAVGRLDGAAHSLPNPQLFVAMYVRREAVLSSQIEGTQSTLDDVLRYELDEAAPDLPEDVEEVVNYVGAMYYGLRRLNDLPLSLRLIREIHAQLLSSGRGAERMPGEFRTSQNWIGPQGVPLSEAAFVPPPPHEMNEALDNLEKYLHEEPRYPALVEAALAHAQFETIHPFLDGNGRVGRLLVTFLLVHRKVLDEPILYLSYFLRRNRVEYYDRLMAVRERGDWEGWVAFFLRGVADTAIEATRTAKAIVDLREAHQALVSRAGHNGLRFLDYLFQRPMINVNAVKNHLEVTFPTAATLVDLFATEGLLQEMTGKKRNRIFRYTPYLALFREVPGGDMEQAPIAHTEGEAPEAYGAPLTVGE